MRVEVRFAGSGGQGIITMGVLLGYALVIYEGKNAVQTQSYGPEARGSTSRSEVVISDDKIYYPIVENPDVFVCMSQDSYDRFVWELKEGGTLIYDSDLVRVGREDVEKFSIPSVMIAEEKFRKRIVSNMVMLGFFTKITGLVSYNSMRRSIVDTFPRRYELNLKAFDFGYRYVWEGDR
ncbi:MAG: 2-oxoacid:acceptor oxidoreductase family protein [Candidatus Odinarchaeota archaeon]|nr:2-oxoacid:acceptor oxidoreductase family protein [Candidatus Odinarchaeota archaeon]